MSAKANLAAKFAWSIGIAILPLIAAYCVFWMLSFNRTPIFSLLAAFPLVGAAALVLGCGTVFPQTAKDISKILLHRRSIHRIFAILFFAILLWGLGRSIVNWSIPVDAYDYGECQTPTAFIPYDPTAKCGSGDLNDARRLDALQIIDSLFAIGFLAIPILVLMTPMKKWFPSDE